MANFRLMHYVWNGLATASALACVAGEILWMRSYHAVDALTLSRSGEMEMAYGYERGRFGKILFVIDRPTGVRSCRFMIEGHSFVSPLSVFALTPCLWLILRAMRGTTRPQPTACATFAATTSTTSDRCPECGTVPSKKTIIST